MFKFMAVLLSWRTSLLCIVVKIAGGSSAINGATPYTLTEISDGLVDIWGSLYMGRTRQDVKRLK